MQFMMVKQMRWEECPLVEIMGTQAGECNILYIHLTRLTNNLCFKFCSEF